MRPTELRNVDRDLASRPPSRRGLGRLPLLVLPLLAACVAQPRATHRSWAAEARVETVPSGARCITADGAVYVTPAVIPCTGEATQVELVLDGHARRRVELCPGPVRPRAASLVFGEFFHLLEGECWERVEMEDGCAVIVLEQLEPPGPAPARWVED
jgi:hypothetical protein